ncbi:hypothetical protein GCM10007108_13480 [Thermogymnomonas acidicola]|uniref:Glycosyltransferase n=1 Tax=Thermogymnomonas acidicola TaxID=399579 RepID=A0AA37F9Y4_9ARCH|nr:hypothetical protein GCM10007108_13480 [Thermogymnomonas acidicola]
MTLLGYFARLLGNEWINFVDDPLLNIARCKKNIKSRVIFHFLKRSRNADFTVIANKEEAGEFSHLFNVPINKIIVIPPVFNSNMIDDREFENLLRKKFTSMKILLFFGNMDYDQNVDSLNYITRDIVPKFRNLNDTCKFVFAGKGTDAYEDDDLCVYMGFLTEPQLNTLIRHSYLVLAPILEKYRKGIKTKVLHALSLGVPVLSTPAGVFGLEKEGLPVFISEIGDFSDTLLELVNGEDRVEKMKERTIDYIEKNYSEKVMERWKRIINMGDA